MLPNILCQDILENRKQHAILKRITDKGIIPEHLFWLHHWWALWPNHLLSLKLVSQDCMRDLDWKVFSLFQINILWHVCLSCLKNSQTRQFHTFFIKAYFNFCSLWAACVFLSSLGYEIKGRCKIRENFK